ncbi:MAG: OsmC family protein [Gemmatimonadaceae bacterium]
MTAPTDKGAASPTAKPPSKVHLAWIGDHRFDLERPGAPAVRIDAGGKTGPGPVDTLLGALAACTATDVVDILAKRRTPVASLDVDVIGERAAATPARVTHVTLAFRITGAGIDPGQAERAVELSVTKYCSVRDTLDPALAIDWTVVVTDA